MAARALSWKRSLAGAKTGRPDKADGGMCTVVVSYIDGGVDLELQCSWMLRKCCTIILCLISVRFLKKTPQMLTFVFVFAVRRV